MSSRLVHPPRLFLASLLVSLVLHGLVAAGFIWFRFPHTSTRYPLPSTLHLEIAQVDPSYAETPDDTAAAVPESAPMSQTPPPKPPEPEIAPPAEPVERAVPCAPQPDTTDLPQPDEPREQFETPPPQPATDNQQPTAQTAPRQAKVDAPPKPRRNIKPDYPKESRQRGEQGNVTLEIGVNAEGAVDDVRVANSSGFPLLDEAAIEAVKSARFTPAKSGCKSVSSCARLTLQFKLK